MKPFARIACVVAVALLCAWTVSASGNGAIRDLHSDGETIWAVGDAGTVLISRDAGQSWDKLEVPPHADFQAVHVEGNTVRLLGGESVFGHGDARGRAVIVRSDDGGQTFHRDPTPPGGRLYGGVFEGPAAVAFGEATPDSPGGVWRTVTAGRRWTPVESSERGYLLGGAFRDVRLGYAVGAGRRLMSIRGLSEPQVRPPQVPSRQVVRAAAMSEGEVCWAIGDDGLLLRSRPGDQPWLQQRIPAPAAAGRLVDLEAVCSPSDGVVHVAGGLTGASFRTEDGGISWRRLNVPVPGAIRSLEADGDTLLAGGDAGRIFRSDDGGESWTLLHGGETIDVLFIVSAADTTVYPAIAAHALAGAEVAVAFATRVEQTAGAPPEQALRAAAFEAGATAVTVFHSFPSPAATNDLTLTEQDVLAAWSGAIDAPAQDEMLRHMVAAIRLYRPAVVAVGPEYPEATGAEAETGTVSRLAQLAADRAGRADMFGELSDMHLQPWTVRRVFVGLEDNRLWKAPWETRAGGAATGNFAIDTSAFTTGSDECLDMIVQRAIWRLGGTTAVDRPAQVTAYMCEGENRRLPLMTTGLTRHSLRPNRVDDRLSQLASSAHLRFAAARGDLAMAMGTLSRIAEQAEDEDDSIAKLLAADRMLLTACGLLHEGRLHEAARAERAFMSVGRSHPLYEQVNVTSLARAVSPQWQALLAATTPQRPFDDEELRRAADAFAGWTAWSQSAAGRMLHATALSATGRHADARETLEALAEGPYPSAWRRKARLELLGDVRQLPAEDRPRTIQAAQVNARGRIDGRMDEGFWSEAREYSLLDADGQGRDDLPGASLKVIRTPGLVVLGIRLPVQHDRHRRLDVAIDSDRDGWTQLLISCDTSGQRSVRMLTRNAPETQLPAETIPLQATRDEQDGYTFELAIPLAILGGDAEAAVWSFQVRATLETAAGSVSLYAQSQEDPRLLSQRYGLLMLPQAGEPPEPDASDEQEDR